MPEAPEVDTDTVREHLDHAPPGALLRQVAMTTAVLAALGAGASLLAGDTVNEALVLKTEAGRLQAEASDQWAYYQAKGIKAQVQASTGASWEAVGKTAPPAIATSIKKYADEQTEIERIAREKEHERDEASARADALRGRGMGRGSPARGRGRGRGFRRGPPHCCIVIVASPTAWRSFRWRSRLAPSRLLRRTVSCGSVRLRSA